jgi:drug/metabolite transporter (DMT)-like permease
MLAVVWEKRGPWVVAAAIGACVYWRGEHFFETSAAEKWHLDALYGSIFNLAAASSAFLFAFYTYVRTAEGSILREIRASQVFRRASKYMIWTVFNSALLAVLTVPFVVAVPEPHHANERWYWAIVMWASLSGYVFACIARSAYHFTAIMEAAYGERLRG